MNEEKFKRVVLNGKNYDISESGDIRKVTTRSVYDAFGRLISVRTSYKYLKVYRSEFGYKLVSIPDPSKNNLNPKKLRLRERVVVTPALKPL